MSSSFWSTQPVGSGADTGIIEPEKKPPQDATALPEDLVWKQVSDPALVAVFLNDNYVEDSCMSYRLSYSKEFFINLFGSPDHHSSYSLGLFHHDTMVGYVLAKKHHLVIGAQSSDIVSVNFLCLDRKYRNQRMAPLLIQEIRRIANLSGIFRGIFTGQNNFGFSFAHLNYFHLPLNLPRLSSIGFIDQGFVGPALPTIRDMTRVARAADFAHIHKLYTGKYSEYTMHEEFTEKQLEYLLGPADNVMYTLYNPETEEFASFFVIDTLCIDKSKTIHAAYLYYWAGSESIIGDSIAYAAINGFDIFNALDCGGNTPMIQKYGFLEGSGTLRYHLFNWKAKCLESNAINFILF